VVREAWMVLGWDRTRAGLRKLGAAQGLETGQNGKLSKNLPLKGKAGEYLHRLWHQQEVCLRSSSSTSRTPEELLASNTERQACADS